MMLREMQDFGRPISRLLIILGSAFLVACGGGGGGGGMKPSGEGEMRIQPPEDLNACVDPEFLEPEKCGGDGSIHKVRFTSRCSVPVGIRFSFRDPEFPTPGRGGWAGDYDDDEKVGDGLGTALNRGESETHSSGCVLRQEVRFCVGEQEGQVPVGLREGTARCFGDNPPFRYFPPSAADDPGDNPRTGGLACLTTSSVAGTCIEFPTTGQQECPSPGRRLQQCPRSSSEYALIVECRHRPGSGRANQFTYTTTDGLELQRQTCEAIDGATFHVHQQQQPEPEPEPMPGVGGGGANSITFRIADTCNDGRSVEFRFFEQAAGRLTGRKWPAGGVWLTGIDRSVVTEPIACQAGTSVCYGARIDGNTRAYWGAGIEGDQGCTGCCYACGSSPPSLNFGCPSG